jgi:predicted nucleic acid-binding protein
MGSKQKQVTEARKMINFVSMLPEILTLTRESSKIYGEIGAELDKNGTRVPQFDLLNASIAIANKISLVTREQRHFLIIKEFSEYDFLELWE